MQAVKYKYHAAPRGGCRCPPESRPDIDIGITPNLESRSACRVYRNAYVCVFVCICACISRLVYKHAYINA